MFGRINLVYAVQAGPRGAIKIGCCAAIADRLNQLQRDNHQALRVLMEVPGGVNEEKALQKHLAKYNIRGEWFRPRKEVLAALRAFEDGWRPEPGWFVPKPHPDWGRKTGNKGASIHRY